MWAEWTDLCPQEWNCITWDDSLLPAIHGPKGSLACRRGLSGVQTQWYLIVIRWPRCHCTDRCTDRLGLSNSHKPSKCSSSHSFSLSILVVLSNPTLTVTTIIPLPHTSTTTTTPSPHAITTPMPTVLHITKDQEYVHHVCRYIMIVQTVRWSGSMLSCYLVIWFSHAIPPLVPIPAQLWSLKFKMF